MNMDSEQIRRYRLQAHHLDRRLPPEGLVEAAGACGLQNSPPGAWEWAAYNRVAGLKAEDFQAELYSRKNLLQAWSYRGAPVVFPTEESGTFLTPLIASEGERPWIYTRGIEAALEFVGMDLDDLLFRVREAAGVLDEHIVKSKEELDRVLAEIAGEGLPEEKRDLWNAPSMYGNPERQTVGGAIVSFLLRPCSFLSLVVFAQRQGTSPTFTSWKNWLGRVPDGAPGADRALASKFLNCYGPATVDFFADWLGCSLKQARRLWSKIEEEIEPVSIGGRTRYILSRDLQKPLPAEEGGRRLKLLGAHDPYLDLRDRETILENAALRKWVWKTVHNPGVILKDGRIVGIWRAKKKREALEVELRLFEGLSGSERREVEALAEEYALFRQLKLGRCGLEE